MLTSRTITKPRSLVHTLAIKATIVVTIQATHAVKSICQENDNGNTLPMVSGSTASKQRNDFHPLNQIRPRP
jgi:hypothetical protein